jgi:peptidoglycan/xylan/chitin deacetylase (PgdA/CDA1 family)
LIPILAYHKVDTQFEWGITTVLPRLFEKQIKFLAENGFHSIGLSDYMSDQVSFKRPIIITFDDSFQSIFRYAYPILNEYGFTATIFVITNFIGKRNLWDHNLGGKSCWHMGWKEIEQLKAAHWEIGSHTATHLDLTDLSDQQLEDELITSRNDLSQHLGEETQFISYPFNRYNIKVLHAVQKVGYRGGCCLVSTKKVPGYLQHYAIPRTGVYGIDDLYWFKIKLQPNSIIKIDNLRQKFISFLSTGSIYYNKIRRLKKNILQI